MAINFDSAVVDSLEGNPELTQENINAMNQMLEQSVGTDLNGGLQILWFLGLWLNILSLVFFVTTAIWLYKLSKKLGDKHSWLAFVPLIQLYTFIKTAWFTFWQWLIKLILHVIGALILTWIFMWVLWFLIFSTFGNSLTIGTILITMVLLYIPVYFLFIYVSTNFLFKGMADRAWESNTTATLMTLFPWCMLWIVAKRTPELWAWVPASINNWINQTSVENIEL